MNKIITAEENMFCLKDHLSWLLTGILLSTGMQLYAQLPDGTKTTREWIDEIVKNLDEEESLLYNAASVYNSAQLSIAVYIVRDDNGMANCNESDIVAGIGLLNSYFHTINLSFRLRPVQYIDDYNYGNLQDELYMDELVKKHSEDRTINLYLVESIKVDSIRCYGFTYFPNDTIRNYIFLDKEMIQGNYLTTLMGHFLGLLSTHETLGGDELVNEKNCAASGDFICDTWADPNLFGWVDRTCTYLGNHADRQGESYVPSVANLMSESYDECKCILTPNQYRRMLYYLKNYRYYLR
jgi:hypothetical protein